MSNQPSVSVVIPVLNEQPLVALSIDAAWRAGADEVIVVDADSNDGTRETVLACRCQLLKSRPGRGNQQNLGAEASKGEVLLFVHADCQLPVGASDQIRACLENGRHDWGGFRQHISAQGSYYRWLENGNAWRARVRHFVYGDQGIWVKRELFQQVSGFPDEPLMEDVELSLRLRRHSPPALLEGPITVSPRRWKKHGIARQTVRNWTLYGLFRLGVSPKRLVKYYLDN